MATNTYYTGFSTRNYENKGGSFSIYNIDVIEADITNEIFTIKGERVMMPLYGTRIPLMVFEVADAQTLDIIRDDLKEVISHDPRVKLVSMSVTPVADRNAVVAAIKLNYLQFNVTKDLYVTINSR